MLVKNDTTKKHYWRSKEINEVEYNRIREIIRNKPTAPDGYGYKLTDSTEWELYELPTADDDEEVTSEEALAELMEVLV